MSDIENNAPTPRYSDEQLGEAITNMMNNIATVPDELVASKNLLAVIAGHANSEGVLDVPLSVLQIELVKSIGVLESRIVALEQGLKAAGIEFRDTSPAVRKMFEAPAEN